MRKPETKSEFALWRAMSLAEMGKQHLEQGGNLTLALTYMLQAVGEVASAMYEDKGKQC